MHQIWRVVPDVLPVVYDADHVVTAGEKRGQVGSLGLVVETLVPRENTVGKVSVKNVKSATNIHAFLQKKNVFNLECKSTFGVQLTLSPCLGTWQWCVRTAWHRK